MLRQLEAQHEAKKKVRSLSTTYTLTQVTDAVLFFYHMENVGDISAMKYMKKTEKGCLRKLYCIFHGGRVVIIVCKSAAHWRHWNTRYSTTNTGAALCSFCVLLISLVHAKWLFLLKCLCGLDLPCTLIFYPLPRLNQSVLTKKGLFIPSVMSVLFMSFQSVFSEMSSNA